MGSATVPVAPVGVAPTGSGAAGSPQTVLLAGRQKFSARGRKPQARRPHSPFQLHRPCQGGPKLGPHGASLAPPEWRPGARVGTLGGGRQWRVAFVREAGARAGAAGQSGGWRVGHRHPSRLGHRRCDPAVGGALRRCPSGRARRMRCNMAQVRDLGGSQRPRIRSCARPGGLGAVPFVQRDG